MKEEYHLVIIWEKARNKEAEIIEDLRKYFEVVSNIEVTWSQRKFSENLSRLYGTSLPPGSGKEEHCGTGPFVLLIIKDKEPIYDHRKTSRDVEFVNINVFSRKSKYRRWTGGGHRVHGTNTPEEFFHDVSLLLGDDADRYMTGNGKRVRLKRDLVGADGWKDLPQLFRTLNKTVPYVVLRNFEQLPAEYYADQHGDIDLLTSDFEQLVYVSNATPVFEESYRVHQKVKISGEEVFFDFRYVGDGYFDTAWERDVLKNQKLFNGIYVVDDRDYYFTLLYHVLIHKHEIASDYLERINQIGTRIGVRKVSRLDSMISIRRLARYMARHQYSITVPEPSVRFNIKNEQRTRRAMWSVRPLRYLRKRLSSQR